MAAMGTPAPASQQLFEEGFEDGARAFNQAMRQNFNRVMQT